MTVTKYTMSNNVSKIARIYMSPEKNGCKRTVWLLGATHHLLNVNAVHFLAVKIPALRGDR